MHNNNNNNNNFSWDSAISKPEKPEWVKENIEDIVTKSIYNLFSLRNEKEYPYSEYYHPSQVHSMCVLQEYFKRKYKAPSKDSSPIFFHLVGGAGSCAHKYFQEKILGPTDILIGDWFCSLCGKDLSEKSLMPKKCSFCGAGRRYISYREIKFQDDEYKIRGKSDGILSIDGFDDILLEIKTKSSSAFENSSLVTRDFMTQVSIYMHFLDLDECLFLFVNRESYDFKSTLVEKDEHSVLKVFNRIELIRNCLEEGKLPYKSGGKPYRRCRKPTSSNALECPFREECWELEDE